MKCPECGRKAAVLLTRERDGYVWRRRECSQGHRFTTTETHQPEPKKGKK